MGQLKEGLVTEIKAARAYQLEVLQVCQKRNAIVRMDTGMGKTFIAIMLIRWLTSLPRIDAGHKICVFLVPTVALVDQQSESLANQTPLRVRAYRGDMGVDFWDTHRWIQEFEDADCVVMTAAIWQNVLLSGYWSLDKVLIIVFDECHHAQKNHPYNKIMQEYHRFKSKKTDNQTLPHILGLTASPVFNPDNPDEHIDELTANLDAVLVNIRDTKTEAGGYLSKPREHPIYYSSNTQYQGETDFEAQLDELEIWDLIEEHKVRLRIENIKRTLGDLACNVYIMNWLYSIRDPASTKESLLPIRASGRIPEIERLHHQMALTLARMPYYTLGDVSDKVKALVNLLTSYKEKQGFQAIVFVEQRHHAQALAMILGKSQVLQTFVRAMHFVGHGASGTERLASEGMEAKIQRRTVQEFREGKVNVLIATSVAEEGLDFQACNLIVRFDFMPTYKGYVQSRGRARKMHSEFVVMLDRDDPRNGLRWQQYVGAEPQLEAKYDNRDPEDDPNEPELENTPRFMNARTGAVLTYGSCIALLDETCALIPSDAYSPVSRPRYELDAHSGDAFSYKIFLPMMPLLPPTKREMRGPEIRTKRGAKQAVAFETCKMLFSLGLLNDHFLPLREGKGDSARDADDELVDRTVLPMHMHADIPNVFGNMWDESEPALWLNKITIEASEGVLEHLGLICSAELDLSCPITMHEPGKEFKANVSASKMLTWQGSDRSDKLSTLDSFTRWVIKQTINRKLIQGPLIYLLAPVKEMGDATFDIDWTVLDKPYSELSSLEQLSRGDLVLAPWQFMRKHIFTIHEMRRDLTSRNMPRITGLTKRGRIFDRTSTFGEALIALLDYEKVDITKLNMEEQMLHLKPWFSVRNNLNPIKAHQAESAIAADPPLETVDEELPLPPWELPDREWREDKVKQHEIDEEAEDLLDPEAMINVLEPLSEGQSTANTTKVTNAFVLPWSLCKISNLSLGFWNACSWLPSLLRAIQDQARAQHAMRVLALTPISFPLLSQALTLPMCCIGKDYQTLETIGDSALKLAVTVVVYNRYVSKDEGGLSARRMNSIDNQHLRMKALKQGLQNHLNTDFFRMRTWVPSTLENGTMSSDGLTIRVRIPRRALSDCIESILGAAYLSGGFDLVLRTGDALGLCFGGPTPWHDRYKLSEGVRQLPVGRGLAPLEDQLGYKFKHGQLLMQGLTHRSFAGASTHCQEREEFLGDAVLDNFVIDRLSRRFPTATPSHLTRLRSVLVSNSALGYLALKVLGLHRYILHAAPLLGQHFERALQEAEQLKHDDFVSEIWLFDPPKPAADAVEGIIGSLFIDCGWKLEPVFEVLDRMFADLFKLLPHKASAPRDPTSRLRLYIQHKRCKALEISTDPRPSITLPARVTVVWHGKELACVQHHSKAAAKQLACKVAMSTVREINDYNFSMVCTCRDDLADRIGNLQDWKKATETSVQGRKRQDGDEYDELEEDMGLKEEKVKDAYEMALEKVMEETFGYNPMLPPADEENDDHEDDEEEDNGGLLVQTESEPKMLYHWP